ncbi:ABC transporter permease [Amorphus sp. 3PC139-8]|uniref:ABC transporter permease n=1 Tax=Amorphus sp. 3PC139-8 TaxID=2735676 RepID=UPI00345DA66C
MTKEVVRERDGARVWARFAENTRLARIAARRLVHALPVIGAVLVLNFFLIHLAPGDAADAIVAGSGQATEAGMETLRSQLGLDRTLFAQLVDYLHGIATLDLGTSLRFNEPVLRLILERLPKTLLLAGSALLVALAAGVALGIVMASFAGGIVDRVLSVVAVAFYSLPIFWIGLMLIVLFSVHLGWLPTGGYETVGADFSGFALVADRLRYLTLPALSLALFYLAIYARLMRASMLEVQSQDFVRTAKAKGLAPSVVSVRHVARNALLPIVTMAGVHVGAMLGGVVVIETIFSWPGLGRLAFEAVMARDFPVLLGILLLSSVLVIVTNILVDLIQASLDPRVEA